MAQTILYYPTIDIQDGTWLRSATLYWDKVSSIMPYHYYDELSPELKYLQERGIYQQTLPEPLFFSDYADDFTKTIISRLEHHKNTATLRSQRHRCTRPHIPEKELEASYVYKLIHCKKLPRNLLKYLSDNNYINYDRKDWLEVEPEIFSIYMRTLAEFIIKASSEDMVIGTDRAEYRNQIYYNDHRTKTSACLALSLDACLPQPTLDISYEDLLNFKEKYRTEFLEFRSRLRDFEKILSECETAEEVKFETERFKESWQTALLQSKRLFKEYKNKFVWGSLNSFIPILALAEPAQNMTQSLLNTPYSYIASTALLGGAALISLKAIHVNYHNKINEHIHGTGFSYLLKASRSKIVGLD